MKIIDSNDLNILNLYIAIKNAGLPTDLFIENIKTLKIEGISQEELSKLGCHEYCSAAYSPYDNVFYYNKEKLLRNRTKNHELIHCASTNNQKIRKQQFEKYKNLEFIPSCGISSFLPGGLEFGKSLNEGLTEFFRSMFVPEVEEKNEIHVVYIEMMSTMALIMIVIGFKELYTLLLNNDSYGFYETMDKCFGKKWINIIYNCDTSFDYQLKYNDKAKDKIVDLIRLKYQLEIINGALKYTKDFDENYDIFEKYFDIFYSENSFNRKVLSYRLKNLKKKYEKKK